jgi:hypothetical protein
LNEAFASCGDRVHPRARSTPPRSTSTAAGSRLVTPRLHRSKLLTMVLPCTAATRYGLSPCVSAWVKGSR